MLPKKLVALEIQRFDCYVTDTKEVCTKLPLVQSIFIGFPPLG